MTVFTSFDALRAAVGTEIGTSDWISVSRHRIHRVAAATDQPWTPAGDGTLERPDDTEFLTLSLLAPIVGQVMTVRCARMGINYGLGKVRFISPIGAGSRIRGTVALTSVTDVPGGVQVERLVTITADGADRPVCVAESLARYLA